MLLCWVAKLSPKLWCARLIPNPTTRSEPRASAPPPDNISTWDISHMSQTTLFKSDCCWELHSSKDNPNHHLHHMLPTWPHPQWWTPPLFANHIHPLMTVTLSPLPIFPRFRSMNFLLNQMICWYFVGLDVWGAMVLVNRQSANPKCSGLLDLEGNRWL